MNALRLGFAIVLFSSPIGWVAAQPFGEKMMEMESGEMESAAAVPQTIAKLQVELREASRAFSKQDFDVAAEKVAAVQATLDELINEPSPELAKQVEPLYVVLERAHGLLKSEGKELPPLNVPSLALMARASESIPTPDPLPPKPTPTPAPAVPAGSVSFVKDVVPILSQRCGGCHISKASGKFSMKDYATLMVGHPTAGIVVAPGNPPGSRLLEVIEGKEMPPSGGGIPAQEYQTLTTWIAEGAKFDGEDPQALLTSLAGGGETMKPAAPTIAAPTGDESVSFARHIAPLLTENCNGCHFKPAQLRGGYNFTTFAGLMEGGDSGSAISPGSPTDSLLVGKLKGTANGQRMPQGRPPFTDEQIALVEKWIAEGAKFDGPDAAMPLDDVSSIVIAQNSTPEELTEIRRERSESHWRLGMGSVKPEKYETDQFMLYGDVGEATLKALGDAAEKVSDDVRKAVGTKEGEPLAKGKITIYASGARYDYGELAKVDRVAAPRNWFGHSKYTMVEAYATILPSLNGDFSNDALLAEQIAAVHVAAQGKDVPGWFSAGAGQMVAAALYEKDPRVASWGGDVSAAVEQMSSPDDFLTGRSPPEVVHAASYSFVDYLSRDRRKFGTLMRTLREGAPFNQAFMQAYGGAPQQVAFLWAKNGIKSR